MFLNKHLYKIVTLCGLCFTSFTPQAEILPASTNLTSVEDSFQFEHFTQTRTSGRSAPSNNLDNKKEMSPVQVDAGYSFSVEENLGIYIATRLTSLNEDDNSVGLSSGVDFQLTKNLTFSSGVSQQRLSYTTPTDASKNQTFFEFSSSYQLTDKLHFFATYDHQIEQNTTNNSYQLGVGFRF